MSVHRVSLTWRCTAAGTGRYPHQVHEVPVDAHVLDAVQFLVLRRGAGDPRHDAHARDDVERVHAGGGVVVGPEPARLEREALLDLVRPLERLDDQEHQAAEDGEPQQERRPLAVAALGRGVRQHGTQRRAEQHQRIRGTEMHVGVGGLLRPLGMGDTVQDVAHEDAAEDLDLGHQHPPDGQPAGGHVHGRALGRDGLRAHGSGLLVLGPVVGVATGRRVFVGAAVHGGHLLPIAVAANQPSTPACSTSTGSSRPSCP